MELFSATLELISISDSLRWWKLFHSLDQSKSLNHVATHKIKSLLNMYCFKYYLGLNRCLDGLQLTPTFTGNFVSDQFVLSCCCYCNECVFLLIEILFANNILILSSLTSDFETSVQQCERFICKYLSFQIVISETRNSWEIYLIMIDLLLCVSK